MMGSPVAGPRSDAANSHDKGRPGLLGGVRFSGAEFGRSRPKFEVPALCRGPGVDLAHPRRGQRRRGKHTDLVQIRDSSAH